jgi:hypothetical protein
MLFFVQKNSSFIDKNGDKIIEVVNEKTEVNLNKFMSLYAT